MNRTLSSPDRLQRNRLAWPHRRQGLASDGVRYADARSSVGRRFRSVTKLRLEWYGGVFLLLRQRSKHPREMVITPKASTSKKFSAAHWQGWRGVRRRRRRDRACAYAYYRYRYLARSHSFKMLSCKQVFTAAHGLGSKVGGNDPVKIGHTHIVLYVDIDIDTLHFPTRSK